MIFYQAIDNAATSSVVAVLSRLVRLNSLYDPDLSGVGSQPVGFDQWSAFYNRYRVISTNVQIRVENRLSASESLTLVAFPTDTTSPVT